MAGTDPISATAGVAAVGFAAFSTVKRLFGGGGDTPFTNEAKNVQIQTSCFGNVVPVVYGLARVAGNIIWMPDEFHSMTGDSGAGGGKGGVAGRMIGLGGGAGQQPEYFQGLAIAICEGPIPMVHRVWADKIVYPTLADVQDGALTYLPGPRPAQGGVAFRFTDG